VRNCFQEPPPAREWPLDTPRSLLRFAETRVLAAVPEARLSAEYLFLEALERTSGGFGQDRLRTRLRKYPIEELSSRTRAWADLLLLPRPIARSKLWSAMALPTSTVRPGLSMTGATLVDADVNEMLEAFRNKYRTLCIRRLTREPLQYIRGEWDFHNISLLLRPPVLIPRPETEELVEHVLQSALVTRARAGTPLRLLDIGCGSGAIVLALLASLRTAKVQAVAIDPNETAAWLTKQNARRNQIQLWAENRDQQSQPCGLQVLPVNLQTYMQQFGSSDHSGKSGFDTVTAFDLVVSNPPYIPPRDFQTLAPEILDFEDIAALSGIDEDGMGVIRLILAACDSEPSLLAPGGELWMEVDPSQPRRIDELLTNAATESRGARLEMLEVKRDLTGAERFVRIRKVISGLQDERHL
jgi:release factor glutamine methyltransferase